MAKKSKSKKTAGVKTNVVHAKPDQTSTFSSSQGFNPDYSYVIKDLKRIGTLAVIFIVVLVGVSFII